MLDTSRRPPTHPEIPRRKSLGNRTWIVLFALAAGIFLTRLHTYEEPLEFDLTSYAIIAHEILGGA